MLAHTGAWARGPEGRLGRTVDLLTTLIADGYDAPRGAAALARINAAHARHAIANQDMLYVLTTFVTEPARVIGEVGPRPLRAVAWWRAGPDLRLRSAREACFNSPP